MDLAKLDLAKFVGAASAPVALIISTSIFLSNLTAKYVPAFSRLRTMTEELREDPEHPDRLHSLHEQIDVYKIRVKWLLRASFYLMLAIICFINTVAFTSVSMFYPEQSIYVIVTIGSMFGGLALLGLAVVIEMWENRLAKDALRSELEKGTPSLKQQPLSYANRD
jgi:multidrug efflux pump subunit AcrB